MKIRLHSFPVTALAVALAAATLAGCAPLLIGGAAVGTAMVVTDRRTSGAQVDDEAIELRAGSRLREALGDRAHINVASYNRQVLLTGEVPSDAAKLTAEQIVSRIENVKSVVNDLATMPATSLTQRSNDTLITGKVRASFVDASDLQANSFRVVTERGVVYLMGRVTQREADRATGIARGINDVQKVVRLFEVISPNEVPQAAGSQPAATPATVAPAATGASTVAPVTTGTPLPPAGPAR